MPQMNLTPLDDVLDKHFGKVGTPKRDAFESDVNEALHTLTNRTIMTDTYSFKPGDWIMVEDEFAKVESIFPMYYEPFDIDYEEDDDEDKDDVKVGDYNQTVISYHTFCTLQGRVCSSKAQVKYLNFCDWIKPMTAEQAVLLEQIKTKKAKAFAAWEAKCKDAKEYIIIYVNTKKGYADAALSKFRKAAKALPERFAFSDVQTILRSIPELKADTANTECGDKDYIRFELCYMPKEQKGKHLTFYKIREFDSFGDFSVFINFELVLVSLYHLVRLYGQETGSEKLSILAERLKEAGKALFEQKFRQDPLAKDFYKHAPKILYTFDTAYATMQAFLERHSEEWDIDDLVKLIENKDEKIVSLYHKILGI